jgi:hypothetical protein
VAEDEANRHRASTTLGKFYDAHGNTPTEPARNSYLSFATVIPGQIQRSPSASRGRGGRGQGGHAPSGNVQGRRPQQGGGASRPCLIAESAPGPEPQARPSALHVHLWLDHVQASSRGSASSKRAASDQGGPEAAGSGRGCKEGKYTLDTALDQPCKFVTTSNLLTNSKCPLCIPPQSQNHCCDIHNVVGNQFHRHYNTKVQIQWS